jgi:hypothetical protein
MIGLIEMPLKLLVDTDFSTELHFGIGTVKVRPKACGI